MAHPFISRELSWLEFNHRVLEQATRPSVPLLDRVKFLAISASNLDEFFQVRVGGLTAMRRTGNTIRDLAGLTPNMQLTAIRKRCLAMTQTQHEIWRDQISPALAEEGLVHLHPRDLNPSERESIEEHFEQFIFPLLTPLALESSQHTVTLPSLQIVIGARLNSGERQRFAFIPIPRNLPRFLSVSRSEGEGFLFLEEVVAYYLDRLFPGETINGNAFFRLTRNTDIAVDEEDASDLVDEMEEVLTARRSSSTVRLQLRSGAPRDLVQLIQELTNTGTSQLYRISGPLALSDFMQLAFRPDFDHLREPAWPPQQPPGLSPQTSIFEAIAKGDILLNHPYESFEPVVRFLQEAARDPQVLSIKQVLYRTAENSAIVAALIQAAESGKQVTVLIEVKARFDEARNLVRAEELQRAGVQVVYGVKGLKTHAKIALVARNEDGRLRRYLHLGTGNYNESTARLYTDISLLTCRPEYGSDGSLFFNAVTGRSKLTGLNKLVSAPTFLKQRILDLIEGEISRSEQGSKALIMAKMNSLQHPEIIAALYRASAAGVEIKLNIRGICCLKPGSRRSAKNITVVSIIDRFLEHSRLFYFHRGGDPEVYFSSADWMIRNLDSRVELMVPVEDRIAKRRLIRSLEDTFKDNTNAYLIKSDGSGELLSPKKGEPAFRSQAEFYEMATKTARNKAREQALTFEPHLPQNP